MSSVHDFNNIFCRTPEIQSKAKTVELDQRDSYFYLINDNVHEYHTENILDQAILIDHSMVENNGHDTKSKIFGECLLF